MLNRLRSIKDHNPLSRFIAAARGKRWGLRYSNPASPAQEPNGANPLRDFFNARKEGRGIWKWEHYFDIYHRHFSAFRNRPIHVVEIGVFSGGSLELWRDYFGPQATIHGVDVEPDCMAYEEDGTKISIGDQGSRAFWREFRSKVPLVDIVIDDGSHRPGDQISTLEELVPFMNHGGVYLCEDIHGESNAFASYVQGLASGLNRFDFTANMDDPERRIVCKASPLQKHIRSISFYPFVVAIEKTYAPVSELVAPKHGTDWQPFIK